jgi:Domain of unknown function (DUF5076)
MLVVPAGKISPDRPRIKAWTEHEANASAGERMGRMKLKRSKTARRRSERELVGRELIVPPKALEDPAATEIARLWIADHEPLHISLQAALEAPGEWGILLVDVARHAARMYQQALGLDEEEVFQLITSRALRLLTSRETGVSRPLPQGQRSGRGLKAPKAVFTSSKAREVARIWITKDRGHVHVILDIAFADAGMWGVLLADVARHVATLYRKADRSADHGALDAIFEMFSAESTDPARQGHAGGLIGEPS